jgi:acetyltransferase-like isoleucine patch superfamily enzyme
MTNEEKRAKQTRIQHILLDNSELSVIHNCINNTLDYEGVDITEPLMTVYDYFMTRLRIACGLPVVIKEGANVGAVGVITKDVPEWSLAVTRSPLKVLEGWVKKILK